MPGGHAASAPTTNPCRSSNGRFDAVHDQHPDRACAERLGDGEEDVALWLMTAATLPTADMVAELAAAARTLRPI